MSLGSKCTDYHNIRGLIKKYRDWIRVWNKSNCAGTWVLRKYLDMSGSVCSSACISSPS